jgi:hypothetical protein
MMKTSSISTLATLCITTVACSQGFINLDFEQAVVVPTEPTYGFLDWSLAVPGWGPSMSPLYYGQGHLGVEPLYLLMDSTSPVWAPGTQLAGNYSLAFASGHGGNDPSGPWLNVGIVQSGFVPNSTQSIRLLATGPFEVFLGGVGIPMLSLGGISYGGDVSGFAGTTAQLVIGNSANVNDYTWSIVDNILFSPAPIPEPSKVVLLLFGAPLLGWRWRRWPQP